MVKKLERLRYSVTKHPYYKVVYPKNLQTGETIKGWWIKDVPSGVCTTPNPCEMNPCGWLQVFGCFLIAWPCCFLPCFFSSNYDGYQIPDFVGQPRQTIIYTTRQQHPQAIPIAVPISNELN